MVRHDHWSASLPTAIFTMSYYQQMMATKIDVKNLRRRGVANSHGESGIWTGPIQAN